MEFWQSMAAVGIGMAGIITAVLVGGWLVFRAKTITMPSSFFNVTSGKTKPTNYVPDSLNEFNQVGDDDLTPAAARLRAQKLGDKESIMAYVKGGKQ
jgi:hypothetical protein